MNPLGKPHVNHIELKIVVVNHVCVPSLSLEYHPKELEYVKNLRAENVPKVKYLQCPGGLRMAHLEKFLCSKFSLSPTIFQIDILYGDEIIRKDIKLMDVVYCFKWQMVSYDTMRFSNKF